MPSLIPFILDTLSDAARHALPYVESLVEKNASSAVITDFLRENGLSFRRTDMLSLIRAVKDVGTTRPYLNSVTDERTIDATHLARPVTTTLRQYSFLTEVRGFSIETGEALTVNVTVSTSDILKPGEIKALAVEIASSFAEVGGLSAKSDPNMQIEPDSAVILSGTNRGY